MLSVPLVRTVLTAYEKGVTNFEFVELKIMEGAHKQPEYLAMNPFGLVPVMVDGPFTLFESRAIMRYMATKFEGQGTPLCGSTPAERALVDQWTQVESHTFGDPWTKIMYEKVAKPTFTGEPTDKTILKDALEKLGTVLDVYDAQLAKNKYLAGDFFSLADLSHLPMINVVVNEPVRMSHFVDDRPHVKAWWADITTRPSWQKVYAELEPARAAFDAAMKKKKESS